jgi:hypothetical protein
MLTNSQIPAAAIPLLAAVAPALVVGAGVLLKRTIGERRSERTMRKQLAARLANHRAMLTEHPAPAPEPQVLPRVAAAGE